MAALFAFLFLSALATWVGSIIFFSFVAAPNVYGAMPPQQAIRAVAPMARTYLRIGWVCATLALVSVYFLPGVGGMYSTTRLVLVVVMFLLALYLAVGMGGKVREAAAAVADAGDAEVPKDAVAAFGEFEETAKTLNGALLLLGLVVVFITAFYS